MKILMARTEKALRDHVQYPRVHLTVYLLDFMRTFLVFLWSELCDVSFQYTHGNTPTLGSRECL